MVFQKLSLPPLAKLEKNLERYFVKRVREEGGKAFKLSFISTSGAADRLVVFPGAIICFVELKREGRHKVLTRQKRLASIFRRYGFDTYKIETRDEVEKWLEHVKT